MFLKNMLLEKRLVLKLRIASEGLLDWRLGAESHWFFWNKCSSCWTIVFQKYSRWEAAVVGKLSGSVKIFLDWADYPSRQLLADSMSTTPAAGGAASACAGARGARGRRRRDRRARPPGGSSNRYIHSPWKRFQQRFSHCFNRWRLSLSEWKKHETRF